MLRIAAHPVDHGGRHRIEKVEADEIEPRLAGYHPAMLLRLAVAAEHRKVDPGESRVESGAPDDVGDLGSASIVKNRYPIANSRGTRHPYDTGRRQIRRLGSAERCPM